MVDDDYMTEYGLERNDGRSARSDRDLRNIARKRRASRVDSGAGANTEIRHRAGVDAPTGAVSLTCLAGQKQRLAQGLFQREVRVRQDGIDFPDLRESD